DPGHAFSSAPLRGSQAGTVHKGIRVRRDDRPQGRLGHLPAVGRGGTHGRQPPGGIYPGRIRARGSEAPGRHPTPLSEYAVLLARVRARCTLGRSRVRNSMAAPGRASLGTGSKLPRPGSHGEEDRRAVSIAEVHALNPTSDVGAAMYQLIAELYP